MKTELKKVILEGVARSIGIHKIYIDHDEILFEMSKFIGQKVKVTIEEILTETEEE